MYINPRECAQNIFENEEKSALSRQKVVKECNLNINASKFTTNKHMHRIEGLELQYLSET